MKVAFFNTKSYDRLYFDEANQQHRHDMIYHEPHLSVDTVEMLKDEQAVCVFINDCVNRQVIEKLKAKGIKLIALRSAGFNHVDLEAAKECDIAVVRVPAYSPYAVAEHTLGLLLALNRHLHRAYNRVREGDFSLNGLMGFDVHGKTVGVIGTGKIGTAFISLMQGFRCRILACDITPLTLPGVDYVNMEQLLQEADIISLHCPLTPETYHLINDESLALMKPGITLLNTSRGRLLDTRAVIRALKTGHVGLLGLDVYEEEEQLFFDDRSETIIQDDVFARLLTFPNVIITGHQAFFTKEAVSAIAGTTLGNISAFEQGEKLENQISIP